MTERLGSGDFRLILTCLLICTASLVIGIRYFYRAFPEASIELKCNRDSSQPIAERFLVDQGLSTTGYRHAAIFRYDDEAKVFLERELGLERANVLIGQRIKLWRWSHRWFKPQMKEEVRVEVTPSGQIAGFDHALPEDAPGANLTEAEARTIAESFISNDMRRSLDSLEYVDVQSQKRPHRSDHVFTWRVSGLDEHNATYRISVTVQGNRVDGYDESLRVPEEWSRNYARLRSLNENTAQVDGLLLALLGLAMLVSFIRQVRLKNIRWKTALIFGMAAFTLQFLESLNELPIAQYDFDTTVSWASFVTQSWFMAFLQALSFGGIIFMLSACAEPVYRQAFPAHLSIPRMFSWEAIRSRRFFLATLVGVTLTFFFFAYEIGFYLLANRLGAWAPADIPYTDLLNTRFPWIYVLLGGFFPAVSEEWAFRAFAIPYLGRVLRSRWTAVILASFMWGFGHANYPNQPFYIRGVEVGIVGLVLSWAMHRFGILAPLIAHYSIDAFYSAFLLLRSGNAYLVASGAITAGINLAPLLLAAGAYLVTRHFRSSSAATNESEGMPEPELPEAPLRETAASLNYVPLTSRSVYAAVAIIAAGTGIAFIRLPRFGDFVRFRTSPSQAEGTAKHFLARLNFDVRDYRSCTQPDDASDRLAVQYVYTNGGISQINDLCGRQAQPVVWETRFYRPLQKEEFVIDTNPADGRVIGFHHFLAEEAPGADLPEEKALLIATSFLKNDGCDLSQFQLKGIKSEKPEQRRDTEFTWEARPGTPGAVREARLRIEAGVAGDKIGLWSRYVKIPESWSRDRESQNAYNLISAAVRIACPIFLVAMGAFTLIQGIRRGSIRWGVSILAGILVVGVELAHMINSIPTLLFRYDTKISMKTFVISAIASGFVELIALALAACLIAALLTACFPDALPLLRRYGKVAWGRDAVVASAAALGGLLGLQWLSGFIHYRASSMALAPTLGIPTSLGGYLPLISEIRSLILTILFAVGLLGYGTYLWTRWQRRPVPRLLLIVGLTAVFMPPEAKRFSEFALDMIPHTLTIGLGWLLITLFLRNNYLSYILVVLTASVARRGASFLGEGNRWLDIQGWALWLMTLGLMVYLASRPTQDSTAAQ